MSISQHQLRLFSARPVGTEPQQPALEPVDRSFRAASSRTNYAGMGVNEGFAIAARSQLANIAAFGTTMTNVNTIISAANTALQSLSTHLARRCRAARRRRRRT